MAALAVFIFSFASALAGNTNKFYLTVELQAGTKLIGQADDENHQFHSEILGGTKLPLEKIRMVEWPPETNPIKYDHSMHTLLELPVL